MIRRHADDRGADGALRHAAGEEGESLDGGVHGAEVLHVGGQIDAVVALLGSSLSHMW